MKALDGGIECGGRGKREERVWLQKRGTYESNRDKSKSETAWYYSEGRQFGAVPLAGATYNLGRLMGVISQSLHPYIVNRKLVPNGEGRGGGGGGGLRRADNEPSRNPFFGLLRS